MMMELTERECWRFQQWVIENISDEIVPGDEGNGAALVYNIVQRLRHGKEARLYSYLPDQDAELRVWGL